MCEILINDLVEELSEENKRLLNELSFERQLNEMLENLRKYSLDLKTNCFCDQNKKTFDLLDQLDTRYKTFTQRIQSREPLDEMQKTEDNTEKTSNNKEVIVNQRQRTSKLILPLV